MDRSSLRKNQIKQKQSNTSINLGDILLYIGLIIASGFLLYNSYRSVIDTSYRLELLKSAENDVKTLRLENLELLLQSEKVKTDYYVELQARDKLNLSAKDEYVVIIPEDLIDSSALRNLYSEYVNNEQEMKIPQGMDAWLLLLKDRF